MYQLEGRYKQAAILYQQALSIWKKLLGNECYHAATSINNLAYLYHMQGRYDQAEPLYLQAIKILDKVLGKDHPSRVKIMQNYHNLLEKKS